MRKSHTISALNLYNNYDVKKLTGKGNIRVTYKAATKKVLCAKIFLEFIELMLNDYVEGDTFHLPTNNISIFTYETLKGEAFKSAYRSGKFDDIDYLMSNFTIYMTIFRYFYRGNLKSVRVILSERYRNRIIEKTSNGFKYA